LEDFADEQGCGVGFGADAHGEGRVGDILDMIGRHEGVSSEEGACLSEALPGEEAARAEAESDAAMGSSGGGELDEIVAHEWRDGDGRDIALDLAEACGIEDRLRVGWIGIIGADGGFEHGVFMLWGRVTDFELHGEAVELGFGEGVSAVFLDGVLGGDDEERGGEDVSNGIDGDLPFGHGFEEGALGARSGAVDFIGEEDIGEDGSGMELEFAGFLVKDAEARDISREEVRGALDAGEFSTEGEGEGLGEGGFSEAWEVLDEEMTASEQAFEHMFNNLLFSAEGMVEGDSKRLEHGARGGLGVEVAIGGMLRMD
jgi:hypothetical protein